MSMGPAWLLAQPIAPKSKLDEERLQNLIPGVYHVCQRLLAMLCHDEEYAYRDLPRRRLEYRGV